MKGHEEFYGAISWQGDGQDDFALMLHHTFVWKFFPMCGQATWERDGRLEAASPFWDLDSLSHLGSSQTLQGFQPAFPTTPLSLNGSCGPLAQESRMIIILWSGRLAVVEQCPIMPLLPAALASCCPIPGLEVDGSWHTLSHEKLNHRVIKYLICLMNERLQILMNSLL